MRHRRGLVVVTLAAGLLGGPAGGSALARPDLDPEPPTQLLRLRSGAHVRLHLTPGGPVVARHAARTDFGSRTVFTVMRRRGAWAQVSSTRLGGARAWLRVDGRFARRATRWRLRADVSARTLAVWFEGRVLKTFRVGVGTRRSPTPTGRFQVTDRLRGARYGAAYGCCILALSTDQPRPPPGWTGMARMAVHGTDDPRTVGRAASAGCLHAGRRALVWMMRRVPFGTPVVIVR